MEDKKLRKGCLFRFSDKHLRISKEQNEMIFSDSILAWWIDIVLLDNDEKEFADRREIKRLFIDCPAIAMMYLDYWGFDVSHNNLIRKEEVAEKFEHHFHVLIEDQLYDLIFVAKRNFQITNLFEVLT